VPKASPWARVAWTAVTVTLLLIIASAIFIRKRADRIPFAREIVTDLTLDTPNPNQQATKSIELNKVSRSGDRISLWTDSQFAPGETTVAAVTKPDGSSEDGDTQTLTIRGSAGARVTTVFSWLIPSSFANTYTVLCWEGN